MTEQGVTASPGVTATNSCAACGATIDPAQDWCWLCQIPLGEATEPGDVVDEAAPEQPVAPAGPVHGVRSLLGRDLPARRAAVLMAGCVGLAIALSSPFVLVRDEPLPQAPTPDGSLHQGVVVPDEVLDQP